MTVQNWSRLRSGVSRYGILVALAVLIVFVSVGNPRFTDPTNLFNIGQQWAPVAIMAIGMTVVLIGGGFDLSVGGTYAFSAVLAASLTQDGHGAFGVMLACLGMGAGAGLLNGFLVTKINVNPLVATLGMGLIIRGLALVYSDGGTFNVTGGFFDALGSGYVGSAPTSLIVMIALGVLVAVVLARSSFGRSLYATGGNPDAGYLSGIRVDAVRIASYVVCGLSAALAGAIYAGRIGSAQGSVGAGIELTVIAAVLIGGTSIAGGEGAMWRTAAGVGLLAVLQNYFNANNVNAFWQSVVQGAIIITAVGLDAYPKRKNARPLRLFTAGARRTHSRSAERAAPVSNHVEQEEIRA
jgi:ribose transport system permease protein